MNQLAEYCRKEILIAGVGNKLFGDDGLVPQLAILFPSYDDRATFEKDGETHEAIFWKRAQLAAGMLRGRFGPNTLFDEDEVKELTIYADYELPRVARALRILKYGPELSHYVDNSIPVPVGSMMELEPRGAIIHVARGLTNLVNKYRSEEAMTEYGPVIDCGMDAKLFKMRFKLDNLKPHILVETDKY